MRSRRRASASARCRWGAGFVERRHSKALRGVRRARQRLLGVKQASACGPRHDVIDFQDRDQRGRPPGGQGVGVEPAGDSSTWRGSPRTAHVHELELRPVGTLRSARSSANPRPPARCGCREQRRLAGAPARAAGHGEHQRDAGASKRCTGVSSPRAARGRARRTAGPAPPRRQPAQPPAEDTPVGIFAHTNQGAGARACGRGVLASLGPAPGHRLPAQVSDSAGVTRTPRPGRRAPQKVTATASSVSSWTSATVSACGRGFRRSQTRTLLHHRFHQISFTCC